MPVFPDATALTGATLTEAQFKAGLNALLSAIVGIVGTSGEVGAALAVMGATLSSYASKTAAYNVVVSDRGRVIDCSGTWTLALPAVTAVSSGFVVAARNGGSGTITVDADGAETIDGVATLTLLPGVTALLVCTGTGWISFGCYSGSGRVLAQAGTAALPGISFALDGDTGISNPAANQLGFETAGIQRALLSATGWQIDVPMTGAAVQSSQTDATSGRLMPVGAFGLGTNNPPQADDVDATLVSGLYKIASTYAGSGSLPAPLFGYACMLRVENYGASTNMQTIFRAGSMVGGVWRRTRASGVWGSWVQSIPNGLVGTVSQSGSVPTGAIIERGANANGDYIRFADGTQMCWLNQAYDAVLAAGANSGDVSWVFPAAFLTGTAPPVRVTTRAGATNADRLAAAIGLRACGTPYSATSGVYLIANSGTTSLTARADLFAVGRWF